MAKYRLHSVNGGCKADFDHIGENDIEVERENGIVVITITDYPNGEDEDNVLKAIINLAPGEWIERIGR